MLIDTPKDDDKSKDADKSKNTDLDDDNDLDADPEPSVYLLTDDAKDLFGTRASDAKHYEWPEQK